METTTAYPFLLDLFKQYESEPGEIRKVLIDLESFLVRRLVCQLNTRAYNLLFVELLSALRGADGLFSSRVREYLLSSDAESNRWPTDREFQEAWLTEPLFRRLARNRVRMVLEAVERRLLEKRVASGKTEKVRMQFGEKLTIEHLMPQGWRKHWPLADSTDEGESRRDRLIHTLGNLTLLTKKLNPAVSNGPWEQKHQKILDHSVLQLNEGLRGKTSWDERQIEDRGRDLFALALEIWPRPRGT
jgi:hypothetical protein